MTRRDRQGPPQLARGAGALLFHVLRGISRVVQALPARWVLVAADRTGDLVNLLDRRGRRVGRQNLDAVFGEGLAPAEKRRILRASMRQSARAIYVLLHAAPMTETRIRRWVDLDHGVEERLRELAVTYGRGVLVSGHVGSWEVLLGLPNLFRDEVEIRFLVEAITHPAIDRLLAYLRGTGGASSQPRRGGARALLAHVRGRGVAAMLVDRNVRRSEGGVWAPFLGLQARTTPLPAWIARRVGVPILPLVCLPRADGRYRIETFDLLGVDPPTEDEDADIQRITGQMNRVFERVIRDHPEAWNWTLKRFKSRPTKELGAYPAYSLWDPDHEVDA